MHAQERQTHRGCHARDVHAGGAVGEAQRLAAAGALAECRAGYAAGLGPGLRRWPVHTRARRAGVV
jgi:hypothetical protein